MSGEKNRRPTRARDTGCIARRQRAKRAAQREMVMALPRPRDAEERLLIEIMKLMVREPRREAVPSKGLRDRCGAKCRDGHACRAPVFKRADGTLARRCRMHGGASTGPKTEEGKRRALAALQAGLLRRWARHKAKRKPEGQ